MTSLRADAVRLRAIVEALPAPRSRLHSPAAMSATDELILASLRGAGWTAELVPFRFTDVDGYLDLGTLRDGRWGPHRYAELEGVNVVATREGESSPEAIVVAVHHDTPRDIPGADDNGAAIALLLEVAKLLGEARFARTVVLAAVDMEEIGMFGSRALVEALLRERSVVGAVTHDTIAYRDSRPGSQWLPPGLGLLYPGLVQRLRRAGMRGDWTGVIYRGFARSVADAFVDALAAIEGHEHVVALRDPGDLPVIGPVLRRTLPMVRQFARSDHLSFWNAGIPAIVVTDTTFFRNPHYHDRSDTPETLDYELLAHLTDATARAVERLAFAT